MQPACTKGYICFSFVLICLFGVFLYVLSRCVAWRLVLHQTRRVVYGLYRSVGVVFERLHHYVALRHVSGESLLARSPLEGRDVERHRMLAPVLQLCNTILV